MRTHGTSADPDATGRAPLVRESLLIALLTLVLAACGAGSGGTPATSAVAPGPSSALGAAAAGLCGAKAALPDLVATKRAFINDAHDALHALAADPGLTRPAAALVLEEMGQLERDLDASADAAEVTTDLAALAAATSAALTELAIAVPSCPP